MVMELPRPKRGIDRLRFVKVLRPHLGDRDAEEVANAIQDEFAPMATSEDVEGLKHFIRAEVNAALLKGVGFMGLIAGIALAIARLT